MKIKLTKKLNTKGFSHLDLVLIIILVIGLGGIYTLTKSHADSVTSSSATSSTPVYSPDLSHRIIRGAKSTDKAVRASDGCTSEYGGCYFWAYTDLNDTSQKMTGASVTISIAQPKIDAKDGASAHSLGELYDSNNAGDAVEIGWIVSKGLYGDFLTHLFVYHWVNGADSCYDVCGFVSTSSTIKPGMVLKPGTTATIGSQFLIKRWWLTYNGVRIGYFPGTIWGNLFTNPSWAEAYGEVYSTLQAPQTQMGNGIIGGTNGATTLSNFTLLNSTAQTSSYDSTAPTAYDIVPLKGVNEYSFGGPGYQVKN